MATRRALSLVASLAKSGDHQLFAAYGSRYAPSSSLSTVSIMPGTDPLRSHPCDDLSSNHLTQPRLPPQAILPATQTIPSRGLWNGWKLGFSSSSATPQEDTKQQNQEAAQGAAGGDAAGAASAEGEPSEAPMSPEELQAALASVQDSLNAERKQVETLKEKLVRTLADMENLRERTARQASEARQFAVQGLVKSLVEVADNLERAAGSVGPADVELDGELDRDRALGLLRSLRDGVVMTDGILMKILEKEGVTRYDPMGQPFDPNLHNALFEVPDATKEPRTVAVVIKKGYMLHDRAVRAADVGVVKAAESAGEGEGP